MEKELLLICRYPPKTFAVCIETPTDYKSTRAKLSFKGGLLIICASTEVHMIVTEQSIVLTATLHEQPR